MPGLYEQVVLFVFLCHLQGRIQDLAMGGGKISSEASYIYERSELHIRAKRVTYTSEASYE